jgi:phage terminase large subunit-like protein
MRRKDISEVRKHYTVSEESVRAKQAARAFELGMPLCPEQYLYNNRPLYAIWKSTAEKLLAERILSYADGDALLAVSKAKLNGQRELISEIWNTTWKGRPRFSKPIVPGGTLAEFISHVADERRTFASRMAPSATVTLDGAGEYAWPEGDTSTIARAYAQNALTNPDVGVLMKQAAQRWLADLEEGYKRGIYWDCVAARNVVTFAKEFGGLPNLLPWQVWALTSMFAFKRATGLRRFTEIWLSMGRKNGKTKFASTVAMLLLICDQEKYAEVYAAATAREQSRIVWRDAKRSVGDNPELAAHVTRWAGELLVKDSDSRFMPLASEERSFLGVRASGIIADEVGVWANRDAWDALIQSTVSRTQPLTLAITTAPAHRMTFAHEKFSWAEKILRGIVQADHVFAAIFRIDDGDDPKDIKALRKANPSLGVTILEQHLLTQIAELDESPSGLNNFLQFHANVTADRSLMRQGSIAPKLWDACDGFDLIGETDPKKAAIRFLELNTDTPCYLGVDIGLRSDLTAIAMLFPKGRFAESAEPIDKMVVICQCFAPENGLLEKERMWGAPLSTWAREDFLQLLPGDMVDLREVKQYIVDLTTKFRVMECGFDPWGFPVQAAELNESGIACVSVPQVPSQLTAPCQELQGAIQRGELVHFGSPMLAWAAGNVVFVESDKHSGLKPEKLAPNEKIDPISAIINAWHRYLTNPPRGVPRMFFIYENGDCKKTDDHGVLTSLPPLQADTRSNNHGKHH